MRVCFFAFCLTFAACSDAGAKEPVAAAADAKPLDLVVKDIAGKDVDLKSYRGKALLIVNVASECGYTPQYAELQQLHQKYQDRGLVVAGFPSNDFGGQEPDDNAKILEFATKEYGVTFPMFAKVHAKGDEQAPLYKTLTAQKGEVKWNFTKFLVDPEGKVVAKFDSGVESLSPELTAAIEKVLPAPKKG